MYIIETSDNISPYYALQSFAELSNEYFLSLIIDRFYRHLLDQDKLPE